MSGDSGDGHSEGPGSRPQLFHSEIIDLGGVDLTTLEAMPGSVLQASLRRISHELDAGTEAMAGFKSSLPGVSHAEHATPACHPSADPPAIAEPRHMTRAETHDDTNG